MTLKYIRFFGFIMALMYCTSCTKVFISEISRPESTAVDHSKSVLVVCDNDLLLNNFVATFEKRYATKQAFIADYLNSFAYTVQTKNTFSKVLLDKSPKWSNLSSSPTLADSIKPVDTLLNNCKQDYLIKITNMVIDNKYVTIMRGGGPNMPMTTSTQEYCVITIVVHVIDVKSQQTVLAFKSKGEAPVNFFAFEDAFINAKDKSIEHAAEYLTSGKTSF